MVLIMSLIEIRSVSKRFGGLAAVSDVDLAVEDGEIHCLIGPNGAGKSTLFKLIVEIYPPTAGSIRFRDVEITRERPYARVSVA
jgi:branched-chain amino acid transport system ATP-binding protein